MGDASYTQTSFAGGEISQWAQGQYDRPLYKKSLAKSFNGFPVDEGTWTRRPGTQFLGVTCNGKPGRAIPFDFSEVNPYNLEFTDNALRMWNGTQLVTTNDSQTVSSISSASPAVFTVPAPTTWATNNQCYFEFSSPSQAVTGAALLNRQFNIIVISPTTFSVVDSVSGQPINGTGLTALTPVVNRVLNITTPYSVAMADWHSLRSVQSYNLAMLLHGSVAPQALQVASLPTTNKFATFKYSTALFQDGPYLDPPSSSIATPGGTSGIIQLVVGYNTFSASTVYGVGVPVSYGGNDYVSLRNNNVGNIPSSSPTQWKVLPLGSMVNTNGFVSTDIGRMIRFFYAPPIWSPATTYGVGANVTYNGEYFTSLTGSNTNNEPDISLSAWTINTSIAYYTWGIITQVQSANTVLMQIQGAPLLDTTPSQLWRLGAWSDTTGWPTCGCYYGGRFWFGGAIPNRIDSSQPNAPFNMAPTLQDGTVADNNGISYTFNSDSQDQIFWMEPDVIGILCGTQRGEWHVTSGTPNQVGSPMTPSSIIATRVTKYGSTNILPVKTGLSLCFVQRYARRLLEYLADVFSGRFYGPDLTTYARHLGARQFKELAYQQELVPIVWGRMGDGSFAGTTYRRISLFSTQEPEFNGWHQHQLGSNRFIESICVGPSNDGSIDALAMVTNDPAKNIRYMESMTTLLDETDPLYLSWFLDTASTPPAAQLANNAITFYGLHHYDGRTVSIFAAGIDCGDYVVENGQVTVPLKTTVDPITGIAFDIPQFDILQNLASSFSSMSVTVVGGAKNYLIPCVVGFNYESQGQLCRPQMPPDTGAKNGPGFGKKRRSAMYAIQLVNTIGVRVGTNLNKTKPVPILKVDAGGKSLNYLETFSGIIRETLEDDFSYNSMLAWKTQRPYPTTVTALGGFIQTEDI